MTPDLLIKHFDRISDAPDAIPRLRGFILDLAVRGKLIPQQGPSNPPASSKSQLPVTLGTSRATADMAPIANIPSTWAMKDLGHLSEQITDGEHATPPRIHKKQVPLVTAKNVRDGFMDFDKTDWVSQETALKAWGRCYPKVGDILLVCVGATTGRLCILREAKDMVLVRSVALIRPKPKTEVDYLALALRSPFCQRQIWSNVRVSAQPCLYINKIKSLVIPLPPEEEQARIVSKVEELMSVCDRLESAQLERKSRRARLVIAANGYLTNDDDAEDAGLRAQFYFDNLPHLTATHKDIGQFRQTILDLAINGKLSRQVSDEESATALLNRSVREKKKLHKDGATRRQPSSPISAKETPLNLPSGWVWVRLSDLLLGDSQNGYSKKPDDASDGIPILRISAGTARGDGIVAEEEHKRIGGITSAERQQYQLLPGDLLACRFNGNRSFVGRLSLYLGYLGIDPIYPDKLIRLRLLPGLMLPKLAHYFAQSTTVRKEIEGYCATTVGNWGISASNLKDVKLPLPPKAEQCRIVDRVDGLMKLCDELEARIASDAKLSRELLEAVLSNALKTTENPEVEFGSEEAVKPGPEGGRLHERTI
jgi:type I restriction enzyme S subunit